MSSTAQKCRGQHFTLLPDRGASCGDPHAARAQSAAEHRARPAQDGSPGSEEWLALLDRIAADPAAEHLFLESLRMRIYRLVRRRLGSGADVHEKSEDVTQDVLVRLTSRGYRGLRAWDGRSSLGGYLARVVQNAVCDAHSRRTLPSISLTLTQEEGDSPLLEIPDPNPGPEAALFNHLKARAIRGSVKHLPADQGEAVARRYFKHQDCSEIARAMGITPGHVAVLLHRGRRRLRDVLDREGIAA